MTLSFDPDHAFGQLLQRWWKRIQDDRGMRADLRRCKSVTEVLTTPAFSRFCTEARVFLKTDGYRETRLAAVFGLLAYIEHLGDETLPMQMAESKGGTPLVSELRFRRLLQERDIDRLYASLIRVLRMLNRKANPLRLAQDVYYWNDRTRKEWAYTYFPRVPEKKTA